MQIRDLIAELQRYDPRAEVYAEITADQGHLFVSTDDPTADVTVDKVEPAPGAGVRLLISEA